MRGKGELLERKRFKPVPDAELERLGAAVGARAEALDPPLRQPRDRLHLRVAGIRRSSTHRSLCLCPLSLALVRCEARSRKELLPGSGRRIQQQQQTPPLNPLSESK